MLSDLQAIQLGALLHDIGKFWQRTGERHGAAYDSFTPADYGGHGAHAKWTASFISQHLPQDWRDCGSPAFYHHKPNDSRSTIVALADRLSAGERSDPGDPARDPARLLSIFPSLSLGGGQAPAPPVRHYYPLKPLAIDSACFFPDADVISEDEQRRAYGALWQGFLAEHADLTGMEFAAYFENLYQLLMKYTWSIPSAFYRNIPDISLFDHARITAAIAGALYSYLTERGPLPESLDMPSLARESSFLFVIGDLSGIQSYLLGISSTGAGGAARRLRARSLYLQLITEVAAHTLLQALELPFLNALMVSGGRFQLLLPNTARARDAVGTLQKEVDRWLVRELAGEVALNLGLVTLSGAEFGAAQGESGFGSVLERAGETLSRRKQNRLQGALQVNGQWDEPSFVLQGFGGRAPCVGCGKHPRKPTSELCVYCETDLAMGRALPEAALLAFYDKERPGAFPILDRSVAIVRRGQPIDGEPYLVMALEDANRRLTANAPIVTRKVCNYVPTWSEDDIRARPPVRGGEAYPGALVTFEDIAGRALGRSLLGYLQADVDRLGEMFVYGLKPERDSPSRLAQMSRMLDLFFSGWLPHLVQSRFSDCYTVYAGGDDLLIVGPWDEVIELAAALRNDFARLTNNPDLHLSAGVFLAKDGFPIARAADGAREILEGVKDAGRNRIGLLGHTLTWDEWSLIAARWRDLAAEAQGLSTAFLYHLLTYARMWRRYADWVDWTNREGKENGQGGASTTAQGSVLGLRFQPLLAYDLARNLDRRQAPGIHAMANDLLTLRPDDKQQRTILDNLGLLAQLWIISRRGAGQT